VAHSSPRVALAVALAFVTLLGAAGCAGPGQYVWYSRLPRTDWGSPTGEYTIGIGDTVSIRIYQQDDLTTSGKIRRDGRIALPLVGEIMVAGKHPSELAREVEGRLKQFVVSPRVTVNVEQSQPITVSTIGEVKNVGSLTLEPPAGLIQALSQAGGPTEYADESRIFVLRQFPSFQRIRFTYEAIVKNEDGAATFPLRSGDVLVFE
jgi:polysaccharide biosynthesis/export protein